MFAVMVNYNFTADSESWEMDGDPFPTLRKAFEHATDLQFSEALPHIRIDGIDEHGKHRELPDDEFKTIRLQEGWTYTCDLPIPQTSQTIS